MQQLTQKLGSGDMIIQEVPYPQLGKGMVIVNGNASITSDGIYKIVKIYTSDLEKIAGNKVYKFTCEINMNGINKICELRYDLETCRWNLFKL